MKLTTPVICMLLALLVSPLFAQDYSVETLNEAAPADDLSEDIANALATSGYRVTRSNGRAIWEFWPVKRWNLQPGFSATPVRLYPFQPGDLVGVLRLPRRGSDFRGQTISRGVYTVRYALQPVDGNHVGTSPTQDFWLIVRAEDDTSTDVLEKDALIEASAAAAESSHPAMLCLQKLDDGTGATGIRHLEHQDWWVLRMTHPAGEQEEPLAVDVVVVGMAAE